MMTGSLDQRPDPGSSVVRFGGGDGLHRLGGDTPPDEMPPDDGFVPEPGSEKKRRKGRDDLPSRMPPRDGFADPMAPGDDFTTVRRPRERPRGDDSVQMPPGDGFADEPGSEEDPDRGG